MQARHNGQIAVVGNQNINIDVKPSRDGIEGVASSTPGFLPQRQEATEPVFAVASAANNRDLNQEQASANLREPGPLAPSGHPAGSKSSPRAAGE